MTETSSLPDSSLCFFRSLFIKTGGDTKKQVSMHEIGNEAGLDKPASKYIAEELMSLGLIAKRSSGRTLSCGIGLNKEGALKARSWFSDIPGISPAGIWLGNHPGVFPLHDSRAYPLQRNRNAVPDQILSGRTLSIRTEPPNKASRPRQPEKNIRLPF